MKLAHNSVRAQTVNLDKTQSTVRVGFGGCVVTGIRQWWMALAAGLKRNIMEMCEGSRDYLRHPRCVYVSGAFEHVEHCASECAA